MQERTTISSTYGTINDDNENHHDVEESRRIMDDDDSNTSRNTENPKIVKRYEDMSHDMIQQFKRKERKLHFQDKSDKTSTLARLWSGVFKSAASSEGKNEESEDLLHHDEEKVEEELNFSINEDHFALKKGNGQKRRKKRDFPLFARKTNLFLTVFNLINDILSPGTMSMSQMIAQSGVWMSIVSVTFFGLITSFTLILLYEMSRGHLKTSLASLAEKAYGKPGTILTCIFIFIFNFGGACGMYIMFGEVAGDLLLYLFDDVSNIFISRTAILLYLTAFLIPIALMKNLSSFAFTSFISVSSVLIITGLIMFESIFGYRSIPSPSDAYNFVHPQFLSSIAGLSFIYVSHDIVFHCFGEMRRPTRTRFYTVVFTVVFLTMSTIFAIGLSGYFLFYDKNLTEGNILDLLPRSYGLAIAARLLLILDISLSVPFALFMPRDGVKTIVETIFPKFSVWVNLTKWRRETYHVIVTLTIVAIACGVGLGVTDLGMFSDLCGGVSATSLAYIIPPALFLKLDPWRGCCSNRTGIFRAAVKILCIIVLVIGVTCFASSIFSVIYHTFILHDA